MSTIKANTLLAADGSTTTQPSIPALDKRMAKAWVNFNGTGTVAIRSSYNVSSITDNNTGDYYVNLTSSLGNSNYAVIGATRWNSAIVGSYFGYNISGSFRLQCSVPNTLAATDPDTVQAVAFSN